MIYSLILAFFFYFILGICTRLDFSVHSALNMYSIFLVSYLTSVSQTSRHPLENIKSNFKFNQPVLERLNTKPKEFTEGGDGLDIRKREICLRQASDQI